MLCTSIYVDDGAVFSSSKELMELTLENLRKHFDITADAMHTYIGIEINVRPDGGIIISQAAYIRDMLKKFGMTECNDAPTPMVSADLKPAEKCNENLPYRQLIGALLFLSRTVRPDIAFAVAKLSQFNNAYDEEQWVAAKRILRNLKGTMNGGLYYAPGTSK